MGFFEKLKEGLKKTKDSFVAKVNILVNSFTKIDEDFFEELEETLIMSDIGAVTADYIVNWFQNPQSRHLIERLREAGLDFASREEKKDDRFAGLTFVLTGALSRFTREEASAIIESFGGKASSSVSKTTSYVLAGENAGSKLSKAEALGIPVLTEEEFAAMIL